MIIGHRIDYELWRERERKSVATYRGIRIKPMLSNCMHISICGTMIPGTLFQSRMWFQCPHIATITVA